MLESVVTVVHLLASAGLIGFILVQHGKGADAGASFGAGASATVFGSQGSATFLSRVTAVLATIFFCSSLALGFFAANKADMIGVIGLPDAKALEVSGKAAADDVPALEASKPKDSDVPAVQDTKQ
jgi:preprotein translocase subunit SecG